MSKPIDQALRYPAARGLTLNVGVSNPLPAFLVDPAFMARTARRFGLVLAHDGRVADRQIIPSDWLRAATTVPADSWHLKPYAASRHFGYGYQTWILPGDRRMFALLGLHGQAIYVDPASRLVMVHTAVRKLSDDPFSEPLALWQAIVDQLGR